MNSQDAQWRQLKRRMISVLNEGDASPEGAGRTTDELRASEREGCCDKHRAESFEAVGERPWVVEEASPIVLVKAACVGSTSEDKHEGRQKEEGDDDELPTRHPKLQFGVAGGKDVEDGGADSCFEDQQQESAEIKRIFQSDKRG